MASIRFGVRLASMACFPSSRSLSLLSSPLTTRVRPLAVPFATSSLQNKDGCDSKQYWRSCDSKKYWRVIVEPPDPSLTRNQIIDSYIQILAEVLDSEEEASIAIYFAFGCEVTEEIAKKIKSLPKVHQVARDSFMELKREDYPGDNVTGSSLRDIMRSLFKSFNQPVEGQGGGEGHQGRVPVYPGRDLPGRDQGSLYKFYSGEPFIDGKAVPYYPKYHEVWVRNNARPQERSWRRRTKFPKMPPNNRSGFPRRHSGFGSNGSSPDYPGDNVTGSSPAYPRGNPAGPPTGYQVNPRGYHGGSFATPPAYQGGSFARPGSHTSIQEVALAIQEVTLLDHQLAIKLIPVVIKEATKIINKVERVIKEGLLFIQEETCLVETSR